MMVSIQRAEPSFVSSKNSKNLDTTRAWTSSRQSLWNRAPRGGRATGISRGWTALKVLRPFLGPVAEIVARTRNLSGVQYEIRANWTGVGEASNREKPKWIRNYVSQWGQKLPGSARSIHWSGGPHEDRMPEGGNLVQGS